tara:strand:- start:5173 stop:6222 length:1050 start_codon:yes stop_codon:yes gene_type:complete
MSSLLENAIVDATALKEAALKNAENSVIEKYADEIKDAVEVLLEQPVAEEDPFGELGDLEGAPDEASPEEAEFIEKMPSAATEGENLCPCPEEEEEITIDFDQLAAEMDAEAGEMAPSDMTSRDQVAAELVQEVSDSELDQLVDMLAELANHPAYDESSLPEAHPSKRVPLGKKFNAEPNKRGWGTTADPEIEHEADIEAAAKKLADEKEELEEQTKRLQGQISELQESKEKFRNIALQLKEKLEDVNLTSARLHYTNRVLNSTSLNERQKNEIVESISKAGSIEEAKVIYETLQSTVGFNSLKRKPKSLSEAISRRSSSLMVSRRESRNTQTDPALERLKLLAGLNTK